MYVEIIRVFESSRAEAALIQSLYFGIMTSGGINSNLCTIFNLSTIFIVPKNIY